MRLAQVRHSIPLRNVALAALTNRRLLKIAHFTGKARCFWSADGLVELERFPESLCSVASIAACLGAPAYSFKRASFLPQVFYGTREFESMLIVGLCFRGITACEVQPSHVVKCFRLTEPVTEVVVDTQRLLVGLSCSSMFPTQLPHST